MISAAVVGLGVGEQHARALAAHPGARVVAVCDLDAQRATTLAASLGAKVTSFDAALADPAIDLVVVASYDDHHAAQAVAALEARKHVFCEKPLCRTLDEARAIARAQRDRHLACN